MTISGLCNLKPPSLFPNYILQMIKRETSLTIAEPQQQQPNGEQILYESK